MPTLLLDRNAIKTLMRMSDVINVVEDAFRMCGEGKGKMPAKTYLSLENGDFRAMPAALPECAGMKWVNIHPRNPSLGLPSIMAILVYNDPETGYPLATMDATEITAYRTGAAAAIASRYLARRDSHTIGIIGADAPGKQELDPLIVKEAIVVVDDLKQASTSGEINVPIQKGSYSIGEVHGTLAELVVGKKKGRTDNRVITVFDSTGIAVEDIAVAKLLFEKAQQAGGYPSIDLIGTGGSRQ